MATRSVAMIAALVLFSNGAFAGTLGYFTTYSHHIEKGEVELMFMNDYTAPSKTKKEGGQGEYFSHMIELEYGVSRRYSTEFMVEWFEDSEKSRSKFTGYRWENRYLLLDEDQFPLNLMVYGEYEDLHPETRFKMETSGWIEPPYESAEGEEADRERIAESRLILSKDFGMTNIALNTIQETDMSDGTTAFGYSFGIFRHAHGGEHSGYGSDSDACHCSDSMKNCKCAHCSDGSQECSCKMGGSSGYGIEFYGALGDSRKFDLRPSRQEHYMGPIFMYHLTPNMMAHLQLAIGLSSTSDNLVRFNVGYEF